MALVKLTGDIESIKGRFGGVYFKRGPEGQHVQAMPRTVKYVRSPAQQGQFGEGSPFGMSGIKGFSGAAEIWLLALCAFFAASWWAYAWTWYFFKPGHEPKKISGYMWYIHYALLFPEEERPPFWMAPHSPYDLPDFMVTYEGMWTYRRDPTDWAVDVNSEYYYEAGVHGGKSYFRSSNGDWFIWWSPPNWIISKGIGDLAGFTTFFKVGDPIDGRYENPVTGKFSIAYIGHR